MEYEALQGVIVTLRSNSKSYYQYNSNIFDVISWTGCVPKGEYQLILYSQYKSQISYSLKVNGTLINNYFNPRLIDEYKYIFSVPYVPKAKFYYPKTDIKVGQYVLISPVHTGTLLCDEYLLSDGTLPSELSLNKNNGNIEGIPLQPSNEQVKISCKSLEIIVGNTNIVISIEVCPENSVPFSIVVKSGNTETDKLDITLEDSDSIELFSLRGILPSKQYFSSYCYFSKEYKLVLNSRSIQWPKETIVKTIIDGIETTYNSTQEIVESIESNDNEKWEYSNSYVKCWNEAKTSWMRYAIGSFPNRELSSNTYYFKRNFYFTVDRDIMYYILNIKHNGGVVIYVNKKIVHRYKIENDWGYTTSPLDNIGFDGKIRLLTYNLKNGINSIAVELHSDLKGDEVFSLKISIEKDDSQCKELSYPSMTMYYDNQGYYDNNYDERYMYIIDGSLYLKYTLESQSNKIGFWFEANNSFPINRFDYFVPGGSDGRNWKSVSIYSVYYDRAVTGISNPPTSQYYTKIKDDTLDIPVYSNKESNIPYYMFSLDFYSIQGMQAIYFEIKSNTIGISYSYTHAAELRLQACKPNYCLPTDKVPIYGYEGAIENVILANVMVAYGCNRSGEWVEVEHESTCGIIMSKYRNIGM